MIGLHQEQKQRVLLTAAAVLRSCINGYLWIMALSGMLAVSEKQVVGLLKWAGLFVVDWLLLEYRRKNKAA